MKTISASNATLIEKSIEHWESCKETIGMITVDDISITDVFFDGGMFEARGVSIDGRIHYAEFMINYEGDPLCRAFRGCDGCPVSKATGNCCHGSPWEKLRDTMLPLNDVDSAVSYRSILKNSAVIMSDLVKFLSGLKKEEKKA